MILAGSQPRVLFPRHFRTRPPTTTITPATITPVTMPSNRTKAVRFAGVGPLVCLVAALAGCSENRSTSETVAKKDLGPSGSYAVSLAPNSLSLGRDEFASSSACQECHAEEYSTWHDSYHRTMTQWATPESVLAPFDTTLESRGRTYQLERRGDEFWVTMLEPELDRMISARGVAQNHIANLPTRAQKVVLTTGSHIAQTYWVETENSIQHLPWMYHIEQQQWIPNEDSFLFPPTDQRFFYDWNALCAKCHSVAPMPGRTADGGYDTTIAELGIACEACHGPGEAHIQYQRSLKDTSLAQANALVSQDPIINPATLPHDLSSQVCAQCHSNYREADFADWIVRGTDFRPGQNLEQQVTMHRFGLQETKEDYADGHWHDGTARTGGDEYLGMVQSECYTQGELSCLSCHSLHNYDSTTDQMIPHQDANESCLQCHETMRTEVTAHTHHTAQSSGSLCVNCHMPHISYALFKGIRSHRIDSPNATVSSATGRPNACNLCHLDQSLEWTAKQLTSWYNQPELESKADAPPLSSVIELALSGDAAQRVIAAWNLGWQPATDISGDRWQAPILAQLLDDPYSVVRYVAYLSIQKMPGFEDFAYDFLGPSTERQAAIERAVEVWRLQGETAARAENARLLLNPNGQLDEELLRKLVEQRDNRPIVIAE